jgi:hypothetical protein
VSGVTLLETLATELSRTRRLPARVQNYVAQTYGVDYDAVGPFLTERVPELEEYEVDLILSPVFTPKLADQAVFAELLGRESVRLEEWPALIDQLEKRSTHAQLMDDVGTHKVPLREVTIKRYVDRLRLDGTIAEPIFALIQTRSPADNRPVLKAVARRTIWEGDGRNKILEVYLNRVPSITSATVEDAIQLLNSVETTKPAGVPELLAWIPMQQEALRDQIATGVKFFSSNVQELHGGGRDQRAQPDARMTAKQSELEFLSRLSEINWF